MQLTHGGAPAALQAHKDMVIRSLLAMQLTHGGAPAAMQAHKDMVIRSLLAMQLTHGGAPAALQAHIIIIVVHAHMSTSYVLKSIRVQLTLKKSAVTIKFKLLFQIKKFQDHVYSRHRAILLVCI